MKNIDEGKKKAKVTSNTAVIKDHEYPVEQLLDNCEAITGYKREVGQGALFQFKEETLTKKEFQSKVQAFLKKEVK